MIWFLAAKAIDATQATPPEGMPEWALQLLGLVVGAYTTIEVVKAIAKAVTGKKNGNGNGKNDKEESTFDSLLTRVYKMKHPEKKPEEASVESQKEVINAIQDGLLIELHAALAELRELLNEFKK